MAKEDTLNDNRKHTHAHSDIPREAFNECQLKAIRHYSLIKGCSKLSK